MLALLEERAETCPSCGHPMSLCRDRKTGGRWQVIEETCEASRVAQATAENAQGAGKQRGLIISTRLQQK